MKITTYTLATLVFLAAAPAGAEVYKCVKNGKVTFADTPCEMGTPPIQGKTSSTSTENSPKATGIQTCSKEAGNRLGAGTAGRIEIGSVSGGDMEAVSYAGATIPARKFFVAAQVITQSGSESQTRDASFTCFTSEDGRRVLKDVKTEHRDTPSKTNAITAPPRDDGLSESHDKKKSKSIRNREFDDY